MDEAKKQKLLDKWREQADVFVAFVEDLPKEDTQFFMACVQGWFLGVENTHHIPVNEVMSDVVVNGVLTGYLAGRRFAEPEEHREPHPIMQLFG